MIEAVNSTWPELAAHVAATSGVAILPFGALEQHGPQLTLSTDTVTANEVAGRLASLIDAVLLPPVHYGETWNNAGYPGTVSLAPATVTAIAKDIGTSLLRSGVRAFVIVNGDWGNRAPLARAVKELVDEGVIPAIVLDYPGMDAAIAEVRESLPAASGLNHAEEIETSIMLAIDPSAVRVDRYAAEYPAFPPEFGTVPMQLHQFSPSGVFGDPSTATADKGELILARTVEASLRVLEIFLAGLPDQAS